MRHVKIESLTPEQIEQKRAADRERYNRQIAKANNVTKDKELWNLVLYTPWNKKDRMFSKEK